MILKHLEENVYKNIRKIHKIKMNRFSTNCILFTHTKKVEKEISKKLFKDKFIEKTFKIKKIRKLV